jgi:hypothetical protein
LRGFFPFRGAGYPAAGGPFAVPGRLPADAASRFGRFNAGIDDSPLFPSKKREKKIRKKLKKTI